MLLVSRAQLEIALLGIAVLPGCLKGPQALTFPFDEHEELARHFVFLPYSQRPLMADQYPFLVIELHHDRLLIVDPHSG